MNTKELIESLNTAIAEEFEKEVETFKPTAPLKETLELDSLSLVDLVALVEEIAEVKIKSDEVKTIKTFEDLYNYVINHREV